ncbi:MAG TPA: alkaline phosphatase family protein [Steroidobacteraceae bacterium]|nr:alkaline phosphatase family protein [Steroidobacteraceae bacterium]
MSFSLLAATVGAADDKSKDNDAADAVKTESPIKHVIILIGENRGTDHTFGVYKPRGKHQTISNILSKGIVNEDGTPGPNFSLAQQFLVKPQPLYYVGAPKAAKAAYGSTGQMPQPNTNGAPIAQGESGAPFVPAFLAELATIDPSPDFNPLTNTILTTGFTALPADTVDTRIPNAGVLPNGPFVLQGPNISDDDYTGDMTHRFYQAWQQSDCSVANATKANPTGCLNDLFPFVMATYDLSDNTVPAVQHNFSEGNEMGFYDAEQEQASTLKTLADRFALSDNFHQSFQGGTGANHFMLGTGDAGFWSDGNGNPITPPANQIANPNPAAGTTNKYTADNNFSNCSDFTQPGVAPIVSYLEALPYRPEPNCAEAHYYMLDNTNPGFYPNGFRAPSPAAQAMIPPSPVRTIGDALNDKKISWAYFGGSYNDAVALSNDAVTAGTAGTLNSSTALAEAALADPAHALGVAYCQICNPFQYATSIMGDTAQRTAHIKDTVDLLADIQADTLPSVSFGKPDGLLDGHPSSSKIDLFEAYVQQVLDALEAHPKLKAETVVFVTWDEAGGYWDSGFIQPIDFFGDGPRIPLLALSEYSTGGTVNHTYADHVSLLKFIERNWKLKPLTDRSRDNLPVPKMRDDLPYVPKNMPALSDLFDMFDFNHQVKQPFLQ